MSKKNKVLACVWINGALFVLDLLLGAGPLHSMFMYSIFAIPAWCYVTVFQGTQP